MGRVAHTRWEFLLALQGSAGRVFKVDTEEGAVWAVIETRR